MLKIENLAKLAAYLDTLPDDYAAFEMKIFFRPSNDSQYQQICEIERNYGLYNGGVDKCGAVACAVGHGPSAGFLVPESMLHSTGRVNWVEYTEHFFIEDFGNDDQLSSNAFEWMFSEVWADIDNTPGGAAKRIRYLIGGGVIPDLEEPEEGYYIPLPEHVDVYTDA